MMSSPHSVDDQAVATEAVDTETLQNENRSLQEENKSLQDRVLRALAEAENARRQAARSVTDERQYAISDFARELLMVVDNLQRTVEAAQKHAPDGAQNSALMEGVEATLRAFLRTLERFGVRPVEAQGQRFDPNVHEAVMEVEDPSQPPGTVTQVLEQGYTLNDRLLRPARVAVSREPGTSSASAPSQPEAGEQGASPGGNAAGR